MLVLTGPTEPAFLLTSSRAWRCWSGGWSAIGGTSCFLLQGQWGWRCRARHLHLFVCFFLHPVLVIPDILKAHSKPLVNPGKCLSVPNQQNLANTLQFRVEVIIKSASPASPCVQTPLFLPASGTSCQTSHLPAYSYKNRFIRHVDGTSFWF